MGLIVSVLGSTGLFAALSDTARTGQNQIDSAPLAGSAELKIQPATYTPPSPLGGGESISCPLTGWVDDLTTGGFTATSVQPGFDSGNTYYCIQNAGSQTVHLLGNTDSVIDVENGCTGDEALLGDTSCGGALIEDGELSDVIQVRWAPVSCVTVVSGGETTIQIDGNETAPVDLGLIAPGEIRCFGLGAFYPTVTPVDEVQRAQSDRIQWRFKFTGQVS
ncbi:MAG TPA: hypothetical protein VFV72_09145 [Candidatus Limnocylindrales bacterium]|nr:hypothetical protein [Candidatus Limnocylindrales bacterium]